MNFTLPNNCAAILVAIIVLQLDASGGTTIAFGSSVGATNLTSTGAPLEDGFVFQLGTFADEFVPTADNTASWLAAWRPASDQVGVGLPGNTASYRTQELGAPFPDGMRANSFSGSVTLQHNEPPFDLGGQLFIWGYDQRTSPGAAEWILISDPSWSWPDGSGYLPASSYTVSNADSAILGELRGDGFEMKTAAVTVPESTALIYEGWLAVHFSAATLADPTQKAEAWGDHADPDSDGLSNLVEYFVGGDPNSAADRNPLGNPEISGTQISLDFKQSNLTSGVIGEVEWSTDLKTWHKESVEVEQLTGNDSQSTMRATLDVPAGVNGSTFFRLTVRHGQ